MSLSSQASVRLITGERESFSQGEILFGRGDAASWVYERVRLYCETFSRVGNLIGAAPHLGNGRARSMRKGRFDALKTGLKFR